MRRVTALALTGMMMSSSVFADTATLAPGKPAGVKEATLAGNGMLIFFGLAIIGGGIALVASQGSGNTPTASTTRTTPAAP